MNRLFFWLECIDRGIFPWRVQAKTVEELEMLRAKGAQELHEFLLAKLIAKHDQNIGTESPIARANIRVGVITTIEEMLGARLGTAYWLVYTRAGTMERLEVTTDGVKIWLLTAVENLSLRQQEALWRVLR